MKKCIGISSAAMLTITLVACGGSVELNPPPPPVPVQLSVDFNSSPTGWVGGYSDFSTSTKPTDVITDFKTLPAPFSGKGLYVFGTNRSDDLFIYVKKKFTGFAPNKQYALDYQITFLSNAASGCIGVGGAPGESVYVYGAAAAIEPLTMQAGEEYSMNIDKGNQAAPGKNALVLGNIANSSTNCGNAPYQEKNLASKTPLQVTADASGAIWLLLGLDSGYEAASQIYYKSIVVTASPTGR